MLRKTLLVLALITASFSGRAQVATGTYPYGTFDSKGPDTINVGNLNMHLSIPVINKPGRGLPFYYNLNYDSSVWGLASTNGTLSWNPSLTFGWSGDTEAATGYISYSIVKSSYTSQGQPGTCKVTTYQNWVYHDAFGVSHPFNDVTFSQGGADFCQDSDPSDTETATDGSGYTLGLTNYTTTTLTSAAGTALNVPVNNNKGAGTVSDLNGNQVTTDGSGNFTDTLGKKALVIAGAAPSNKTFTYVDSTGVNRSVTMTYKQYTVQTSFGCSGIGEYGPLSNYLVDSISLPDGSVYRFSYEATPGASSNVTGRLAGVTLPAGGAITYAYSGGNDGIVCSDGSTAGLTRSLAANVGSASATTTYARTVNVSAFTSHTDVTDGLGNHSGYDFVLASNTSASVSALYYETNRSLYQGSASGTPLLSRSTCYDGGTSPCLSTRFTLPISKIDTYETLNGGLMHGATAKYNTYGLQTERDTYDFGATTTRGSLLRKEVWTYPSSGIVSLLSSDTVTDGSGNQIGQGSYAYDETSGAGHAAVVSTSGLPQHAGAVGPQRGNLTTATQWNNLGTAVTSTASYEDTGNALNSGTPNGSGSYNYDAGTHAFMTTSTPPTPSSGVALPTSMTNDAGSGVALSATDANGSQAIFKSYDSLLRLTELDTLDSSNNTVGKITYSQTPTTTSTLVYQNSSTYQDLETQLDAYGRASRAALSSASSWYQQDACYDANGNLAFSAYPYTGTGWSTAKVCSGEGDTYSYDGLGRTTSVTHSDNTVVRYSFTGRATKVVDENGVTRISQVDGLGRVTSMCEVSSAAQQSVSPVNCGQDIAATGFLTTYAYSTDSSSNQVTTVTQGQQTRIFKTDSLGRTVSVTEPERGTTTYSYTYNSTGLVVTRKRPKANQTSATVLTTTTTQYDSVGRVVSLSYDDGLTLSKTFDYDKASYWSESGSQRNLKGRLSLMSALSGSTLKAGTLYSYDGAGRINNTWQCTPTGCGNAAYDAPMSFSYDWAGNVLSASDPAAGTIAYGRSTAGELTSITNQTYTLSGSSGSAPIASNYQNGANGPIGYTLGNGLSMDLGYDGLGRIAAKWLCAGTTPSANCSQSSTVYASTVTWQGQRALSTGDSRQGAYGSYGYDDFNRLASSNFNNNYFVFSYVYDRYGNRWAQNAVVNNGNTFSAAYDATTNRIVSSGYGYDAAGNMTNDSFHSYVFDADGNILQVDGGSTAAYIYDANHQRVRAQVGSATSEYLYDAGGRRVSTYNAATGVAIEARILADGRQVAFRASDGRTYFDHQDYLGTEHLRTDLSGAVAVTLDYWPWGDGFSDIVNQSAADQDLLQYAGLDRDLNSSGAVMSEHAQFRNYSYQQGRWLSPDPYDGSYDASNPQSFNRYAYVLNNPLSYLDKLGLDCNDDNGTWNADGNVDGGCYPPEPWQCVEYGNCPGQGGIGGGGGNGYTCVAANGSTYPCSPVPPPKPLPPIAPSKDRLHCASSFANQFSIAGITGLDNYHGFGSNVLNGALGNTFSGLVDAYDSYKGQNGKNGFMLLGAGIAGGVSLGIPLPSSTPVGLVGPVNVAVNAGLDAASASSATTLFAETAIGEGISGPVALAKAAIDLATFGLGLAVCH